MSKRRILDYLVYAAVRLTVCVIQALSIEQGRWIASRLARVAYWATPKKRDIAKDNLRLAFPGRYAEAELDRLVFEVYRHFLNVVIEIAHVPRKLHANNWRRYIRLQNADRVVGALLRDQPVILLTGHFGNWEIAGYVFGVFGFPSYSVARPLDNPYLDRFLRRFRERTGQHLIPKKGGFDQILEVLGRNGLLSFLADQDAGSRGLFVEFFGRPASTHKAIALMALEHRCPILVGYARRTGERFHYEVGCPGGIEMGELAGSADDVREITQRFTTLLEGVVRSAPEQYLWLHRRWKSRPGQRRSRRKTPAWTQRGAAL
jgi:KDO2-lipid IV(A) lauroyltransferase